MKSAVACSLLLCAWLAQCTSALDQQTIHLRGEYGARAGRDDTYSVCLPGHPCPMALPSGPNGTIWHGNGECSILFLSCEYDRIRLRLYSPRSSSEVVLFALGDDVTAASQDQYPAGVTPCSRHVSHGMVAPQSKALAGAQASMLFSTEQCGTKVVHPDPENTCHEIQTNNIKIVEFLEVSVNVPPIHYVSTTQITVECCVSCGAASEAVCPVKPSKEAELARCTEKSFSFECKSNHDTERFRCDLSLNALETLGTQNVGYYVDSCRARPAFDLSQSVEIFAGSVSTSGLQIKRQVCNAANVDTTKYILEGPTFQFQRDPAKALEPHVIQVDCTVKLVAASELAALQAPLNDLAGQCALPLVQYRSDVGLINAGKLTLLK